jgi:hypothetical protein
MQRKRKILHPNATQRTKQSGDGRRSRNVGLKLDRVYMFSAV